MDRWVWVCAHGCYYYHYNRGSCFFDIYFSHVNFLCFFLFIYLSIHLFFGSVQSDARASKMKLEFNSRIPSIEEDATRTRGEKKTVSVDTKNSYLCCVRKSFEKFKVAENRSPSVFRDASK